MKILSDIAHLLRNLLLTLALLMATGVIAQAACSRTDVDHYLSKGFTTGQITIICGEAEAMQPDVSPVEPPEPSTAVQETEPPATASEAAEPDPVTSKEPAPAPDGKAARFLREAIDGENVHLGIEALHYTIEVCIPYGTYIPPDGEYTDRACKDVDHEVALKGMKVSKPGLTALVMSKRRIFIRGNVQRRVADGLDDFTPLEQRQIIENLDKIPTSGITVRKGFSVKRVIETLKEIST